jgi:hypothetical protein
MRQRALSVPWTCWEIPMPQKIIDPLDEAYRRATLRIVSASIPQIGAIASGENRRTFSTSASYPDVRSRTNAASASPSSTITWSSALRSATSVSGLNWR